MTINEATLCKLRGMSREQVIANLVASRDAALKADLRAVDRAYGDQPFVRPTVAYEYNGR